MPYGINYPGHRKHHFECDRNRVIGKELEEVKMKQFEIGKTYFDTWACDSDSISTIKIVGRSAKMVTFERNGKTRRARIYTDANGEYIIPDHYSMACVYRAERELLPEEPKTEQASVVTEYTVSPELVAFAIRNALFGSAKKADFLTAVVTGSKGVN